MAALAFVATITGIPTIPSIIEVNVRSGPGTNQQLIFKSPLQTRAGVLDVRPDVEGNGLNGKVYQWLLLSFPNNLTGWVRDDLIHVEGDGSKFGYNFVASPVLAFSLTRQAVPVVVIPTTPVDTPPATTTPPITTTTPPTTPGKAYVISRVQSGVNIRGGASPSQTALGKLPFNERAEIVGSQPELNNGSRFRWINIRYSSLNGWLREDLVRLDGDYEALGLGKSDTYPCPMTNCYWIRDFNLDPNFESGVHLGWDFAARVGEPITVGPQGGTVMRAMRCTRCTPNAPSAVDQGLGLNNSAVLNSPEWGYGYGHYLIIRYLNQQLPESTRQALASRNLAGGHIYAMYAHLNSIDCAEGQSLTPNAMLGTCGNTGNSSGAHLHLEIRASLNPNDTSWSGMRPNLLDPIVLFRR